MAFSINAQALRSDDSVLNSDNYLQIAERNFIGSSVLDARWQGVDLRWRVDAAKTHLSEDESQIQSRLLEFNKVFKLEESGFALSIGKRVLSWDPSFIGQPLAFFQKQTDLSDPTDAQGKAEGLPMVVVSWVGEQASITALYSQDDAKHKDGYNLGLTQSAFKFGYEFSSASAALILRKADGESRGAGITFSTTVTDAMGTYISCYTAHGTLRPILGSLVGMNQPEPVEQIGYFRENNSIAYPRVVAGLNWTLPEGQQLQFEAILDKRGLSDDEYDQFLTIIQPDEHQPSPLLLANRAISSQMLTARGIRQRYMSISISTPGSDWGWLAGIYYGLDDTSSIWFVSLNNKLSTRFSCGLSLTYNTGPADSERMLALVQGSITARMSYHF